jgi:maleate isomerase/arylmalonate decarboxylase
MGVLVPFTNCNLEPDLVMLRPPGVSLHFARLGGYDRDEIPDEKQMAALGATGLDEPLRLISGVNPDVVLYGCTSATLTHGLAFDRSLAERIKKLTGAKTVTAAGALLTALEALDVRRIGFASPYVGAINRQAIAFFAEARIETRVCADVGRELGNYGQGALTPEEVFDLGRQADHPEVQAIVLSCTDMRSVEAIEPLEEALGKPVISSNQAMLFAALQALSVDGPEVPIGSLLRLRPSA